MGGDWGGVISVNKTKRRELKYLVERPLSLRSTHPKKETRKKHRGCVEGKNRRRASSGFRTLELEGRERESTGGRTAR